MKSFVIIFSLMALVSCGPRRPGKHGSDGVNGTNGKDGISYGIHMDDATSDVCANGGVVLSSYSDLNRDARLDLDEPIHQVKTLCNGINGAAGVDGQDGTSATVSLESIPSGAACPTGGVMISSSTSSPVVVCNGINGLNGTNGVNGVDGLPGIQGPMGPQGPAGVNGTSVVPVKFCANSSAPFPEYGLKIGNDVFAVMWNSQAFLAKLTAGTYHTTTGNQDCNFTLI